MVRSTSSWLWFGIRTLWQWLDASRRFVFNALFLLIVVAVLLTMIKSGPPVLQERTVLVLNLQGDVLEQRGDELGAAALEQLGDQKKKKTQLRDVLMVLDSAAKDPHISGAVLMLDDLNGIGLASLHEVAGALQRFKARGKSLVAWGSGFDQRQYFLASQAQEVWLHPMGMVYLEGFGRYRNYYRDALDRLGISVSLIRVGTYKSAAEPFIANGASGAAKQADAALYQSLWNRYTHEVEQARKLPEGALMGYINEAPKRLAEVGGDSAQLALKSKLVDGLKTRDELRDVMIKRGAADEKGSSFRQITMEDYLALQRPRLMGDAVGVVVAEGEIVDGVAPMGMVGGQSTAELIRKARNDASIKAIVLRVNSPGGSAFGSELIRRELELTRQAGKPVVVSMGDVAASGGYWIAMAADKVMADASTVTGSIGVFALLPNAAKAMDKLGIHTDGVTTTWLAGAGDPRRPLDPRFASLIQSSIDHVYSEFTTKAAKARRTTAPKIDAVAQGRVWSGAQAKEHGLVDELGSFNEALQSAAALAKLPADHRVVYLEREPGRLAELLRTLGADAHSALATQWAQRLNIPTELQRDLGGLAEVALARKPFSVSAHCLCGPY